MKRVRPESLDRRFKEMLLLAEKIRETAKKMQLTVEIKP